MSVPVIAIDGPSASGKGTIAQQVANKLGFHYLESGMLYRVLGLISLTELNDRINESELVHYAKSMQVRLKNGQIFLKDQDITDAIRSEGCGNRASEVAKIAAVRAALTSYQRSFRKPPGLVADGRDMGTVVFPDAGLKVFLTASPEVRAERRYKQLKDKGINANLRALSRDLQERDARDANRAVAPLVPAPDAQVLDSSALSIEEVVDRIVAWTRERNFGGRG